jgi:hypothetical protein
VQNGGPDGSAGGNNVGAAVQSMSPAHQ